MEREQSFEEFRRESFHRPKGAKGLVTNSIGVYDVYKMMRKKHWYNIGKPVSEKDYYAVIRGINKRLAEEAALGHTVKFPLRMGKLELRKYPVGVKMVDGKVKITYPVDWNETLKLWYSDVEAERQKTLLRNENPYVYFVRYCKEGSNANYENKFFYQFALNTFIKRALSKNIKQGKVDTIW